MPRRKKAKAGRAASTATASTTRTSAGVEIARYNPAGGPILAQVSCGFAQPGAYDLLLWEAGQNVILMEERGNFLNADDDEYPLPGDDHAEHDGRHLQALVTVAITPPELHYAVSLSVSQDGTTLATDLKTGLGHAGDAITRTLWVKLVSA
jgi:hypothetical protein